MSRRYSAHWAKYGMRPVSPPYQRPRRRSYSGLPPPPTDPFGMRFDANMPPEPFYNGMPQSDSTWLELPGKRRPYGPRPRPYEYDSDKTGDEDHAQQPLAGQEDFVAALDLQITEWRKWWS